MMGKKYLLFIFIVAAIPIEVVAGGSDTALKAKVSQWMDNANGIRFLENKGQMMDMQRKAVPNVLYEASSGGMSVYVTTSGLSYVFTKMEKHLKGSLWDKKSGTSTTPDKFSRHHETDSITETYCRADMQLIGATIKKENIIQDDESTDRSDYYYGGVCPDGILGVHSYGKVTIKNIYPGIDWVLHSGKKGLKYDFIVHPGANPLLITLKYKWTDQPQLQPDGSVKISTPMGNITEGTPVSYCNGEQVQTTYVVKDSEIHFDVSNYNTTQALTIDPTLVWGSYYCGNQANEEDEVQAMQEDGQSVWVTGTTNAPNFPTFNPGGGTYFQGILPSNGDIYILQFNTAGVLKWATFYGGVMQDISYSIYSDGTNVWVTGCTASVNFPLLNPGGGAYFQGTIAGREPNAFVLQFTTAGVRKWATYYGGSSNLPFGDIGNSIYSDGHNVWVTGEVTSNNFPTLNPGGGAYYQGVFTGTANAFILQFTTAGVRKWATYYGGNLVDIGYAIYSDGINAWVTGWTESTNFPVLNPGGGAYYQGTLAGVFNTFILKFDMGGVCKWATYYGGSGYDMGSAIYSDKKNVWLTGNSTSPDFPTYNPGGGAYFQGVLTGTANAFILKFDTGAVSKWATYYGGNNVSEGFGIQSYGQHVWVSGSTGSTDFPTLNPGCGFYQDTLGLFKGQDAFILQFDTGGVCEWATYYGDDVEDDGSYVWTDGTNLFIAGDADFAYGSFYPLVNPGGGAYYQDTAGVREGDFVGKFVLAGVSDLNAGQGLSICRGDSARLNASGATFYSWKPATGLSNTNTANPYAKPKVTTTYTVTGIDTGFCGGTYTDTVKVIVDTLRAFISKDTTICSGSSVTLHAGTGTNFTWSTGSTTSSTFIANDTVTRTFTVMIQNGMCQKDTNVTVTVLALPKPVITGALVKCEGAIDTLMVSSSVSPTTYKWGNGSTSTSIVTNKITSDTTIYVTAYNSLGCPVKDSFEITEKLPPSVTVNPPTIACSGSQVLLKAGATGTGPFTYRWSPGGKSTDTITVNPDTTTYYSVLVSNGCDTLKTTVVKPDNPILEACCDHLIFAGDDTVLVAHSPTAKTYQWSPQVNCLNPVCDSVNVSPIVTTPYTVTMTDSLGCQVERVVTIVVESRCSDFMVPNVFTPDDAGLLGLNNVFYIKTRQLDAWSITVYDRWGVEMYNSINPNQYWDGNTKNGCKAPAGVYYYIIQATCQGTSFKKDGFLQLIR